MLVCTNFSAIASQCNNLETLTFPSTISAATTTFANAVYQCPKIKTVTLPTTRSTSLTTATTMFTQTGQLTTINNINLLGSTGATPLVSFDGAGLDCPKVTTLSFSCPMSKFGIYGSVSTKPIALSSLRFTNTNTGQWTGTSPQIDISYSNMSTVALNTLFADIAAQGTVTSKTINITGATGAAGLSAANRLVITSKGWTITG
jgi:hypothetical protein